MCPNLWLFVLSWLMVTVSQSHSYDYCFINESKSWKDAQSYCRKTHTDLATVWDLSDLKRLCPEGLDCTNAWIGLYNQDKDSSSYRQEHRSWHWSLPGAKPIDFDEWARWSSGEPNDGRNGKENCVFMFSNGTFNDHSCCSRRPFICYNESSNTTELVRDNKTWLEALHFCRETYTDLLSGPDQINDPALKDKLNQSNVTDCWVGLYRDPWAWSDEGQSSFRDWHENYTLLCEDSSLSYGKCAKLGERGRWMSDSCAETHPFICYDENLVLIRENLTWEEALDYCRENHSDLASITSEAHQRLAQIRARKAQSEYVWLGSHFSCFLELWTWVSEEFLVYENWNQTETSECHQCVAMERGGGNRWFKKNQHERYNFICTNKC